MRASRQTLSLLLGLILVFSSVPAWAAGNTMTMSSASLSIMPEYDAMNVIVVASGTFTNDTGKPFQEPITWLMAKGGTVSMVCETERGMACQAFRIDTSNPDYDQVTWRPSRVIQPGESFPVMFEYTMNKFTAPGERKFTVPFQSTFPISNLSVDFKEPKNASNLTLNPASTQMAPDGEGFTTYYYTYPGLKPQEKLSFAVSYTRNETKPSKEPIDQGTVAGQNGASTTNPLAVVILVIFLAVLGIALYYAMSNNGRPAPKRNGGGNKARQQTAVTSSASKPKAARGNRPEVQEEKRRIRKLLVDGKINEETYRQMIADINEDDRSDR